MHSVISMYILYTYLTIPIVKQYCTMIMHLDRLNRKNMDIIILLIYMNLW